MVRTTIILALSLMLSTCLYSADTVLSNCFPVSHSLGSSCVSPNPMRVVVLDTGELDIALALGVTPIAATTPYQVGNFPDYLPLEGIELISLGVVQEPDLERLMTLKPDLILGSRLRHGRLYPLLSSIAPTVFTDKVGATWADNVRLFAKALNRENTAEALLNKIDHHCQQILAEYEIKGRPELSIVRSLQTHIRLYLPDSFIGSVMARCGLQRPSSQSGPGFARRLRSPEQIDLLDGDIVLLSEYSPKQGSLARRWQRTPFWSRLEGHLYKIDDSYWMLGIGPLAVEHILDDLEQIIHDYPIN
ncbi:iron-siderophore ABC transporter substrate-binding protein [Marinomonas sp. UCMA 3892]|uniref:iron-siderophore ABC transporter substrate-binding protein n=1 Tax=unclassified Marinomonas TaxID=196814 RepID=UPI000C1F19FF|nr:MULTISPECIES: iron-siderophore ABC transporter substrate-binding protein [unclassified Marinomonas]NLU99030.1 iron-siderophore ABC transporter substrate-binding protein [Marinomonas sp. UCMA 3892]PJE53598.1 hypothetical protein TY87_20000 [Marinomonas sp. BSi20584]